MTFYEPPRIEAIEAVVETGYAGSSLDMDGDIQDWKDLVGGSDEIE